MDQFAVSIRDLPNRLGSRGYPCIGARCLGIVNTILSELILVTVGGDILLGVRFAFDQQKQWSRPHGAGVFGAPFGRALGLVAPP